MSHDIVVSVDPDLVDLFPAYLSKRREELRSMGQLIHLGRFHEIEVIGHKISGNAALFGLEPLGKLAGALEKAAQLQDLSEVSRISQEMSSYLSRVRMVQELP